MFAPKTLITVVAVMAGLASAAPTAETNKATFSLVTPEGPQGPAGCVLEFSAEVGIGCSSIVPFSSTKSCDDFTTKQTGPACNGTATVDFSASPVKASWVEDGFTASCELKDGTCTTSATSS